MAKTDYYFAADAHLALDVGNAAEREQRFVHWLEDAAQHAKAIYLLGDIFDFWCEYKNVVPKGYVRTLGKLAELTDKGVEIHFFTGNHDLWTFGYLAKETGVIVHHEPLEITLEGKTFYLAHGDMTGAVPKGYKILRTMFASPIFQCCFSAIHPRWGVRFAHRWSHSSRLTKGIKTPFRGDDEQLMAFAKTYAQTHAIDYFIFGHRHTPIATPVNNTSQLFILGEWIEGCEYAVFDGNKVTIRKAYTI
ncbi:MAG: UDP-2,3-diacylglucosamine diphosphatase [Prevotellaceae bacterium]|jgi:UDP-2,3-diacylglucosamine hydrolase|nr:UDP-2,3-diacylglucosamine diphosphatase [Prevotellaceae bacterium]